MLHSRLMEYVDQVARLGSIRAAGGRLHVAPSAINRQILLLEEELGEPLFERLPRGMRPTPAGEILVAHIRSTMQQYRETIAEMQSLRALPSGEITVATVSGLASSILPATAARFRGLHPDVHISIRTMSVAETLRAVSASEVDLGLGFNIPASPSLEVCWQRDAPLGAVLSPDHPLASLAHIPIELCATQPLVFADRAMHMHRTIADSFADMGLSVDAAFRASSIDTMKQLAATGSAIAFLSRFDIAADERDGRLVFKQLSGMPVAENVLSLVRPLRPGHTLAGELFAGQVIAALEAVKA